MLATNGENGIKIFKKALYKKTHEVLLRVELRLPDSESGVLTITP